jgi:hypothetical protein
VISRCLWVMVLYPGIQMALNFWKSGRSYAHSKARENLIAKCDHFLSKMLTSSYVH